MSEVQELDTVTYLGGGLHGLTQRMHANVNSAMVSYRTEREWDANVQDVYRRVKLTRPHPEGGHRDFMVLETWDTARADQYLSKNPQFWTLEAAGRAD
ncbi:hypothetical protein [Bordetella petrii]|uniref:Uncharacterized protein n=1 Tax=Bordetella petrii (strain ATCC BAA-461 / DSM 12804 / CCUG 43448 / CIP 107267 / Se-1111R) TaxID=340100 RepID=A9I8Y7_BORPD|nr:hypothetical protein [Bordetella petrii]CAP41306.1 hypothetical protein predicted by Glimmer/Critica [Bordetella petrii]